MSTSLPPDPIREPHLLRFRIRQMLFMVTFLSVLCALFVLTEGPWPLIILFTVSLVAAHVFGTLIGTRLRDTSQDVLQWRAAHPKLDDDAPQAEITPTESSKAKLPPTTPLADHNQAGNSFIWYALAGMLLGLILGGSILTNTIGPRISWPGWLVGTFSCGILGGWTAFLLSSFGAITRHAWRHAHGKDH